VYNDYVKMPWRMGLGVGMGSEKEVDDGRGYSKIIRTLKYMKHFKHQHV
jgi:hypothetical protein